VSEASRHLLYHPNYIYDNSANIYLFNDFHRRYDYRLLNMLNLCLCYSLQWRLINFYLYIWNLLATVEFEF